MLSGQNVHLLLNHIDVLQLALDVHLLVRLQVLAEAHFGFLVLLLDPPLAHGHSVLAPLLREALYHVGYRASWAH